MMKTRNIILSAFFLAGLCSCTETREPVTMPVQNLILSETTKAMYLGETSKMSVRIEPENVADTTVIWASQHDSIATVDPTGLVTAIGEGTSLITATVDNVTAQCRLTVTKVLVESITLSKTELEMEPTGSLSESLLEATILPENATDKTIEWTSSDEAIATVDASGLVKAHKEGTCDIKARSGAAEAVCHVFVLGSEPLLFPGSLEILVGKSAEASLTLPVSMRNKPVEWISADPSVASVTSDSADPSKATIKAESFGSTIVTATVDGKKLECRINVPATLNLDDFTPETFKAEIAKLSARKVTKYILSGDFTNTGMKDNNTYNPFLYTGVESIDFSAVKTGWPKVKIAWKSFGDLPKFLDTAHPGFPGKSFNNNNADAPDGFTQLKEIILPEEVQAIGRFAVQGCKALETFKAPGAFLFAPDCFGHCQIKEIFLNTKEMFKYSPNPVESPFNNWKMDDQEKTWFTECTLHIDRSKSTNDPSNTFGITTWKAVICE